MIKNKDDFEEFNKQLNEFYELVNSRARRYAEISHNINFLDNWNPRKFIYKITDLYVTIYCDKSSIYFSSRVLWELDWEARFIKEVEKRDLSIIIKENYSLVQEILQEKGSINSLL